jgi:replicative DNA helicase
MASPDWIDRKPPYDLEAELGLLGSVMLLPSVFPEVAPLVAAEDFYDEAHGKIFACLHRLNRDAKIDSTLLADALKTAGHWESVGGSAYVGKVINAVPNAAHAVYYAEIVAEKAIVRRLIQECTDLLRAAYGGEESAALLRMANDALARLGSRRIDSKSRVVSLAEAADAMLRDLEQPEASDAVNRAMFGIPSIDEAIGPIMPGEICIVAARPSMGKTAFAQQVLYRSALRDRPSLLISLEMTDRELATRDVCRIAHVDSRQVRDGTVQRHEVQKMRSVQQDLGQLPFYLWTPPAASLSEIRNVVSREVAKRGIRLVAVDYLTLIDGERSSREERREQLVKISRGLKSLAKEYSLPMIVLAQLNRQSEAPTNGKRSAHEPTLAMLAECGAIERDADMVLFIHREPSAPADQRTLIAAKARNSGIGRLTLQWHAKRTEFSDLPVSARPNYEPRFDQQFAP